MIDILVNYSQPLGFIIWIFFILTMENLGLFLKGLSMKSDFRTNVNWFKKLLENRSKKWNITIVEDENMVINDLISNLKHHYLISGFFWFWPILYLMVAPSSWMAHHILLGIEIVCTILFFVNIYLQKKAERKIIMSAVKQ
jgi:hypothetical protein